MSPITLAAGLGDMTSTTLTSAGLAVGIGLLAVEHYTWWRGSGGGAAVAGKKGGPAESGGKARDPKALVPFWFGVAFGTLMVACPAGLLGYGAGILRWGGNGAGGLVMSWMTGQDATTIANAAAPRIDGNGALVVTVLVIVLYLLRKKFAKIAKGRFWKGVLVGVLVAIGTGIFAVIGNMVVPGVNDIGAWCTGVVVHSDFGGLV
ncbi:hypothetical protein PV356_30725 [Streptomyces sp. WI03-5b]|uniref:hypothetical protein n=1 Tax=Streptomyces sp. WI03-5b TaxID=462946 RepID=UPI0029B5A6F9|nr:hypothetical protein [Streptomyces sp. WI03-5b]MDX2623834.1 hypothetical protein [Streptomyces sp. WI03-5b]